VENHNRRADQSAESALTASVKVCDLETYWWAHCITQVLVTQFVHRKAGIKNR
jgi:hypothetical protein